MPVSRSVRLAHLQSSWRSAPRLRHLYAAILVVWYAHIHPIPHQLVWLAIYTVELYILSWLVNLLPALAH